MRTPIFKRRTLEGNRLEKIYRFKNGWGALVYRDPWSDGGIEGWWTLQVIIFYGGGSLDWEVSFTHPESSGGWPGRGYLTDNEVDVILGKIEKTGE